MKEYLNKHKVALIVLAAALCLILVSSFFASLIQSGGFKVAVTDLRDVAIAETKVTNKEGDEVTVGGRNVTLASGILFMPKSASATNQLPAVVLTHGYLNNRELQLQNAIELARRGFIVLTIDRGGHGNNQISTATSAMMNTSGMYEAVQYLATLPEVDNTKIGISGHSMGGYTTNATLTADSISKGGKGLISAGLAQGYNPTATATVSSGAISYNIGEGVSYGILKAKDDEFFFRSTLADGTASICRQYLHSTGAAGVVGVTGYGNAADSINIVNGGIYTGQTATIEDGKLVYSGGTLTTVAGGQAAGTSFRVIYESDEIHPLNHFSTESAGHVVNFFYTAFGTPNGYTYIAEGNQTWWLKEAFSCLGLVGFFALIFPLADLLLSLPLFASLRKKTAAEGEVNGGELLPELKGVRKNLSYWIVGVVTTLFSGFAMRGVNSGQGFLGFLAKLKPLIFTADTYFAQDTTGWVATWAVACGLFALLATGIAWIVNALINKFKHHDSSLNEHPFAAGKIGGIRNLLKTLLLAAAIVGLMYLVLFINWDIWKVDFRIWTFDVKVFEVEVMVPTMLRYSLIFFIFYFINSVLNQNYRVKNLPEWATIAINACFNVLGIFLVFMIQYGTFRSTGVLWHSDMALGYIVLFPIIPVLILATVISRRMYARTGNAWLGALINTLLFTAITVANTAASYPYAGLFA